MKAIKLLSTSESNYVHLTCYIDLKTEFICMLLNKVFFLSWSNKFFFFQCSSEEYLILNLLVQRGTILCHLATGCHWYRGTGCSWHSLCYFQTPLIIYDLLVLLAPRMVAGCLHKLTRTPKGMLRFFKSILAPRRHDKNGIY